MCWVEGVLVPHRRACRRPRSYRGGVGAGVRRLLIVLLCRRVYECLRLSVSGGASSGWFWTLRVASAGCPGGRAGCRRGAAGRGSSGTRRFRSPQPSEGGQACCTICRAQEDHWCPQEAHWGACHASGPPRPGCAGTPSQPVSAFRMRSPARHRECGTASLQCEPRRRMRCSDFPKFTRIVDSKPEVKK